MPNHIKNRIELIGSPEQIADFVSNFSTHFEREARKTHDGNLIYENKKTDKFGWYNPIENTFEYGHKRGEFIKGVPKGYEQTFDEAWDRFPDFEKVRPMPKTLNLESGSLGENAHELLFGTKERKFFPLSISENQERFSKLSVEDQKKAVELAIQYQENLSKYGATTWYDWSIQNWGTKWNAYSCSKLADNTFIFETAWSGVPMLIEAMSRLNPEVTIKYAFSDEDTGCNCGIGVYRNGEIEFTKLQNESTEAYNLAFELRPDRKQNYKLVGNKYEYVEED